jgi:general secretion pathway protein G
MNTHITTKRAFTLVEILIVVIILGILAAIVIPQFANASSDAKMTNLKTSLANVRNQIEIFKTQHNDVAPALSGMWTIMLTQTDTTEATTNAPTGTHWGPYLQAAPINPFNNMTGVSSATVDTNAGWFYQPAGLGFTFYPRSVDGSIYTVY